MRQIGRFGTDSGSQAVARSIQLAALGNPLPASALRAVLLQLAMAFDRSAKRLEVKTQLQRVLERMFTRLPKGRSRRCRRPRSHGYSASPPPAARAGGRCVDAGRIDVERQNPAREQATKGALGFFPETPAPARAIGQKAMPERTSASVTAVTNNSRTGRLSSQARTPAFGSRCISSDTTFVSMTTKLPPQSKRGGSRIDSRSGNSRPTPRKT